MTPSLPPTASSAGASSRAWRRAPGSSLTAMRRAWKVRVATWMRVDQARRGTARLTAATRSPVVASGLALREPVHERGGGLAPRRVETHVERLRGAEEGEAARRLLELVRRHAEVEEDRARPCDAVRRGGAREVAEALVGEAHAPAERREARARAR